MMRGAIAIGSNSTRMLAAEKEGRKLQNILRGRVETKLFLGLDEEGNIQQERLEFTARAVSRLAAAARAHGAKEIALFATSATRDAKNGEELGKRIYELCGLSMQVITGEEEARLAFRAVAGEERRLVMDIGGGSTEFTLGETGVIAFAASAQMGASRLLKSHPIACISDAEEAIKEAKRVLSPFAEKILRFPKAQGMIGLGGSCTTAAAIQMKRIAHGDQVEGEIVSLAEARRQLQLLSSLPLEERKKVPGLPPERAVHMPHGLCILIAAMELLQMDAITVSGRNNLDGYLL